ncbi:Papilin [Echinococcus granulosus]|nr:Papilin [Echinococcus granulosus]
MRPLIRKCSLQTFEDKVLEAGYTKMRLSLAMVLSALAILLLNVAMPARVFDSRLSIGAALDTSEFTIRTVFPASVGEQVHMFQFPFQFYGRQVDQIKIYSNGFIALGNHSLQVPPNYPSQTAYSKHRLNELEGDFIGVFTTVNQCSQNGNIIIRDLDVNEVESSTCVWDHVSRIGNIIDTAAPYSTKRFVADYILTITWENMGCFPSSHPLVNTFTLALLRMEKKSYAVFQYENIQWTADHSTSSLPPEGGIFVHGVATPQLPRNNMHIEPNVWNEESNIAVPGEWLFPLYDAPIDVDVAAQSKIRMATEDFLETSAKNCPNMTAPSAKTPFVSEPFTTAVTETAAPYTTVYSSSQAKSTLDDDVRLTTDLEQQFERCSSSSCANSMADCFYFDGQSCCVCPPNYYGGGEEGCWSVAPEKPRRIYFDGDLRMNLATADGKLVSASVFLSTEVRQGDTILSQSGIHDEPQNFPSIHVIAPIFSILNTFLALPRSQDSGRMTSRLFNIFSLTAGFSTPFNFTFTLDVSNHGRLGIRGSLWRSSSTEDTFRGSLNMEITPDGQFMPLSSRLIGSDGLLQTENKLDRSMVHEKSGSGKVTFGPQTYNLKSEEGQTISIRVYGSGETAVRKSSCLLMENSLMAKGQKFAVSMGAQGYCREDCRSNYGCSLYCVDVPVYSGAVSDQSEDVCNLPTEVGPCKASIQRYTYNRSTGRCEAFYYGGCKGNENNFEKLDDCQRLCESSYQKDQCAGVRCGLNAYCANGYCYCNAGHEGDANTECRPVSSDPCVNVRCGLNAYCASGYCYCTAGYDGDANTECRPTSTGDDPCRDIRCGYNSHCSNGRCECDKGYSGDAHRECLWAGDQSENVCSLPTEVGPCAAAIQRYTYNRSTGRCEAFYYGGCGGNTNNFKTLEECQQRCESSYHQDPCQDVRCGTNAYCTKGRCFCPQGYDGNPQIECRPSYQSEDVCSLPTEVGSCAESLQRYTYNRSTGRCEAFYYSGCHGNANNFENLKDCQRYCESSYQQDPCVGVRCGLNAYCANGYCYCNAGHEGDANTECRPVSSDPCVNVRCGLNAYCASGYCYCTAGYDGDANTECRPTSSDSDLCRGVRCGYNARCIEGRCKCEEGYSGDPYRECRWERDPCRDVRCGANAYCTNGQCFCQQGYLGDPQIECRPSYEDRCRGIQCGYYAHCSDGRCQCDEGYSGDPYRKCQWAKGQSEDVCSLPTEVGPCLAAIQRYAYNRSSGRCEVFYYGGCQGNANNFDNLVECQQRCESLSQRDPCANVRCDRNAYCVNGYCYCNPGYEGDGNTYCRPASSGGDLCESVRCGENAECLGGQCKCMEGYYGDPFHSCQSIGGDKSPSNPICRFPIDAGQCYDRMEKYGYDSRTGRCEKFFYTGCLGNENRFDTFEECERECGAAQTRVPFSNQVPDKCFLPLITGTCGNAQTRFGFYPPTQRCEEYSYSGCGGNENNFETRLDCETVCNVSCANTHCGTNAVCVDTSCVCLPGHEGNPRAGCKRFRLKVGRGKSQALKRSGICYLPLRTGPCHNRSTRYGYFPPLKRCVRYTYGGCRGTQNNFLTEAECEQLCKDPCDGVRCGYNARCVEGQCVCEPGFGGDPNYECKAEKMDKCFGVRCSVNARCQDGYCVCEAGHRGDPYRECRPADACRGVRCGYYARCVEGRCECEPGYTGDAYSECRPEAKLDLCEVLGCDENAVCLNGECKCRQGFTGNPYEGCVAIQYLKPATGTLPDPCHRVACGKGAFCDLGTCRCPEGFQGNPYIKCQFVSIFLDLCRGVTCGLNAQCIDGHCKCLSGYEGDPQRECRNRESCRGHRCGPNAYCRDEVCHCETGYQGNPYTGCVQISDRCDGVQCASNAYCANGYCRCNPGYAGDGFIECHYQGSCANVQCGVNAHCVDGRCACWPGYTGDPDSRCDPAADPSFCNGRRCGQNAVCDQDRCICKYGFEGDPYYGCTEIPHKPERCGNTYCHERARCHSDTCYCEYGYAGDGVSVCEKVEEDLCKRVHCAENAECEAGLCQCKPGFKGDGFSECNPVEVDPSSCNGRYCGANAECRDNVCVCVSGHTGDPYDICTRERPLSDSCHGIECGSNAYCQNGGCVCYEGFEGDPSLACKPIYDPSCMGIRCGANAYCRGGRCICPQGYMGDANQVCYPVWGSSTVDVCNNLACHPNASCSEGQCHCNYGFEGDGFIDCWSKDPANLCDCRGVPASMAGCSNGKCRCMPGFRMTRDNYCEECRGNGGCAANAQCIYDRQIQHYRCACDPDYLGDGAIACIPGVVANRTEAAQCRAPCHRFATCDEYDGRCKCRPGFIGNGYTYCNFDCNQCLSEAQCVPESSQCVCPPGYIGDGVRVCRPATSQGLFTLRIVKESETIRVREDSGALTLRCVLSGDVRNVQARWLTPGDVGRTDEQYTHEGRELWLTISQPSPKDSGLYVCQASRVSDTINVVVEPQQKIQTKQLFLTSDNGILTVQTQSESTTAAQIWHIAENNKHRPVALALDCKTDRLVYTSDAGRALRFGNASAARLNQPPELIFQDNSAKFTWIAVDPASGNIFAIDEDNSRIVVVNSDRPNQVHTYKKLTDRRSDRDFVAGGIAVHPGLSLVYWAQVANSDSEKRESVIKVASMADPERVSEITRVTGALISLSLAVTDDVTGGGNTAGRLCWLQRRQLMPYSRTEIHCAQLETSGRTIHSKRLHKSFDTNEEPSCGLIQDDDTILWTSLYRKIYRSLNPSTSIYVKGVCCSNGFQSMAIHNICKRSMTNACSYENGRCRYFCLPGGREMAHICRCPDDQPNCIAEHAKSRFLGYAYS